ncbi:uncharacterized protein LOC126883640, partial [Diabrotica virgifera virgifera]|uniref:Uncharacterized protein n=1 Tax=Diabrotica virgifera virgifera TaxID=50390 RepID=A0ABM5K4Y6_DIAVI
VGVLTRFVFVLFSGRHTRVCYCYFVIVIGVNETAEWHGDQKIFCVTAISAKSEEKGSTAEITEGGVDHSFVTIKMESGRGHGLEYNILIYAK